MKLDTTDAAKITVASARHLWSMQWKLAGCCCWRWWRMAVQEDSKPEAFRLDPPQSSLCRLLGEEMCSACALW